MADDKQEKPPELKPCPFCGQPPSWSKSVPALDGKGADWWQIACGDCEVKIERPHEAMALRDWNRRYVLRQTANIAGLLNCPFCDGKPRMDQTTWGFYVVRCTGSGCRASSYHKKTEELATRAWNTRAVPAPAEQAERVARLTMLLFAEADQLELWANHPAMSSPLATRMRKRAVTIREALEPQGAQE